MAIIFGIDGIGVLLQKGQSDRHRSSYVRRIIDNSSSTTQEKKYLAGPTDTSGSLDASIAEGYRFVRSRYRAAQGDSPVLLAGYGRGAAGIIRLARRLEKRNISVNAMLLFDAVERYSGSEVDSIPNSVKSVLHVRRQADVKSRPDLISVGSRSNAPTTYEEKFFSCTHAAMGGAPWVPGSGETPDSLISENREPAGDTAPQHSPPTTVSFAQDKKVSGEVWDYVQAFRGKHRFI